MRNLILFVAFIFAFTALLADFGYRNDIQLIVILVCVGFTLTWPRIVPSCTAQAYLLRLPMALR